MYSHSILSKVNCSQWPKNHGIKERKADSSDTTPAMQLDVGWKKEIEMKIARLVSLIGIAVFLQLATTGTALAHHPEIGATAYCDYSDYNYYIDWTSSSWCKSDANECKNDAIEIYVNNMLIETGAFTSPAFSFSGTYPAPEGGSQATVKAFAAEPWLNGYSGGQSAEVTVFYGDDPLCVPPPDGRFTGGGHQIKTISESGEMVRVTRGLTLHCDLLLSNNLQINWQGKKFHMTEHMETVQCSDSPDIDQFPPAAPLDTLIGKGVGRFQNEYGYSIEFTLVDAGDPGVNDQMQILIFETADPDNVVLSVPLQVLSGGNLQAHYDQPHK